MFAEILSNWILWALQVSCPDSWAHIERPMCSVRVCVCVCVHTRAPTYTPTRVKKRKSQDNTSCSQSPRQATSVLQTLVEHPHTRSPTQMNKLRTHERMCTPCSHCVTNMYGDVNNTCGMYTSACTGAQDTCGVHTTLTAKNVHTPAQVHLCDSAAMPSPCKPLRPILQLQLCQRNYQIPQQPMAQPQLCCHASII